MNALTRRRTFLSATMSHCSVDTTRSLNFNSVQIPGNELQLPASSVQLLRNETGRDQLRMMANAIASMQRPQQRAVETASAACGDIAGNG
jgi:hypothetical protein